PVQVIVVNHEHADEDQGGKRAERDAENPVHAQGGGAEQEQQHAERGTKVPPASAALLPSERFGGQNQLFSLPHHVIYDRLFRRRKQLSSFLWGKLLSVQNFQEPPAFLVADRRLQDVPSGLPHIDLGL